MLRKNADKNTPWGYERKYLKDKGREVFAPSDFITEFTKPLKERLKKEVGKFPTVKSCIQPHLKRPYLFICDIEDAFGSVFEDDFIYKTTHRFTRTNEKEPKDSDLRFMLSNSQYLVFNHLTNEFKKWMKNKEVQLLDEIRKDNEFLNEYFDDKKISMVDEMVDKILEQALRAIFYYYIRRYRIRKEAEEDIPAYLKSLFTIEKLDDDKKGMILFWRKGGSGLLKKILGIKTYKSQINDHIKSGGNRADKIRELFEPNILRRYLDIIAFRTNEYLFQQIPYNFEKKVKFDFRGDERMILLNLVPHRSGIFKNFILKKAILSSKFDNDYEKMLKSLIDDWVKEDDILNKFPDIKRFLKIENYFISEEKKSSMGDKEIMASILYSFIIGAVYTRHHKLEENVFILNETYKAEKIHLFHEGGLGLIQGSSLSPYIFELYCKKTIDKELKKLSKEYNIRYTRYRDDLIFSSRTKTIGRGFRRKVRDILVKHYFFIKNKKTKIVNLNKKGSSVKVLGAILTKKDIDAPKDIYERMNQLDESSSEYQGLKNWADYIKSIRT